MTKKEWALAIRHGMLDKGMSMKQYTEKAGCCRMTIWKALQGDRSIKQRTIDRMSDVVGVERINWREAE